MTATAMTSSPFSCVKNSENIREKSSQNQRAQKENMAKLLCAHVGAGKTFTFDQASALTGISEAVIRMHARGETSPNSANFLAYLSGLGLPFSAQALAPLGVIPVEITDIGHAEISADLAVMLADLAEALRDGRVDHLEKAALWPHALEVGRKLISWAMQQRDDLQRL